MALSDRAAGAPNTSRTLAAGPPPGAPVPKVGPG